MGVESDNRVPTLTDGKLLMLRVHPVRRQHGAEHVAVDSTAGEALCEIPHDLLHASADRIEFT